MKKIGVITWFHYENYGTLLQAAALQTYLKNKNTMPELIEVPFYDLDKKESKMSIRTIGHRAINHFKKAYISSVYKRKTIKKSKKFHDFIYDNFSVRDINGHFVETCNKFDLLICGSDQIWNPNWFNDFYFANFPNITTPKISYAPSIGVKHIPDYLIGSYYNALKSFECLSVREASAQLEIKKSLGLESKTVVDPVFLLSKKEWLKIVENKNEDNEDYILCYMLSGNKNHWKAIHSYAKINNLKLKIITMEQSSYFQKGEKIVDAGPKDFLKYVANAELVLTDSFHACVFSIIFNRPFYVFERTQNSKEHSQNSRIYNLLNLSGLQERLLKYNTTEITKKENIDYKLIMKRMNPIIYNSKKFLNKYIN